jgi:hypothetical protein
MPVKYYGCGYTNTLYPKASTATKELSNKDLNKEKTELNNLKGYFKTMCDNLNIKIIQANSPRAKGRIERSNKTHQDRLVKTLRFNNIITIYQPKVPRYAGRMPKGLIREVRIHMEQCWEAQQFCYLLFS